MGDFRVKRIENDQQRSAFYHDMIRDLEAFELMLREGMIEDCSDMIGAEQELCIIDAVGDPASKSLSILNNITDPHYTNELALFNMEINLDPHKLKKDCFSKMEESILHLLSIGNEQANKLGTELFLTGILPTIKFRHLQFENMTPEQRYKLLSNELLEMRGADFEIYLDGVDYINTTLETVLFEACNTSFQLHLQISPHEFIDQYNWAQMISGPVLSACTNSPLLFGKELWSENRIGLFKQSLDTRNTKNHQRVKMSRVYFGQDWLKTSPIDIWKNELIRFPLLLRAENAYNSLEVLKNGGIPSLRSIRLHNGTTYTWNRMCYGKSEKAAHIRIECRYLPAGPSVIDEVANLAFWVGLMKAMPEGWSMKWPTVDFRSVKNNFVRAARTGIDTVFDWDGKHISAQRLILDKLLPMAETSLYNHGVNAHDINKYLGVIRERVSKHTNGSEWMVASFRRLLEKHNSVTASNILTTTSQQIQKDNIPVHEWPETKVVYPVTQPLVEHLMRSRIYAVQQNMSLWFAEYIMDWKNVRHLPVENKRGELVGIISAGQLENYPDKNETIRNVMSSKIISCLPSCTRDQAKKKLIANNIHSLLVVENERLVGIITDKDVG